MSNKSASKIASDAYAAYLAKIQEKHGRNALLWPPIMSEKEFLAGMLDDVAVDAGDMHAKNRDTKNNLSAGRKKGREATSKKAGEMRDRQREAARRFFEQDPKRKVETVARLIQSTAAGLITGGVGGQKLFSIRQIKDNISGVQSEVRRRTDANNRKPQ